MYVVYIGESLFTVIASSAYAPHFLTELQKNQLRILKGHNTISFLSTFKPGILDTFRVMLFKILKNFQGMFGSLALLPPNNAAVFDSWYCLEYYMKRGENYVDY